MDCAELRDKLADYTFGNLSAAEQAAFAAALSGCPDEAAEYETGWRPLVEVMPLSVAQIVPPPSLRARVLQAATAEENVSSPAAAPTVAPRAAASVAPLPVRRRSHPTQPGLWAQVVSLFTRPQFTMSALSIMLLLSLLSLAWGFSVNGQLYQAQADLSTMNQRVAQLQGDLNRTSTDLSKKVSQLADKQAQIDALLADRDSKLVALDPTPDSKWPQGGGTAVFNPQRDIIYINLNGPNAHPEKDFQIWGLKDGKPVSLGVFNLNDGAYLGHTPAELKQYSQIMISWEPHGGSVNPSKDWIVVAGPPQNG